MRHVCMDAGFLSHVSAIINLILIMMFAKLIASELDMQGRIPLHALSPGWPLTSIVDHSLKLHMVCGTLTVDCET